LSNLHLLTNKGRLAAQVVKEGEAFGVHLFLLRDELRLSLPHGKLALDRFLHASLDAT
jgi:hypothetical protein